MTGSSLLKTATEIDTSGKPGVRADQRRQGRTTLGKSWGEGEGGREGKRQMFVENPCGTLMFFGA